MMTINQWFQFFSYMFINLAVIVALIYGEEDARERKALVPYGGLFLVSVLAAYAGIALYTNAGGMALIPILLMDTLKYGIPGVLYYVRRKNIRFFVYYIAYYCIATLIKELVNQILSFVTKSTDQISHTNYQGRGLDAVLLPTLIAVILIGVLIRKRVFECVSYKIVRNVLLVLFAIEFIGGYMSVLKVKSAILFSNLYVLIATGIVVWGYLEMKKAQKVKRKLEMERIILNQYSYYHSLKEQELSVRKLRHDLANHMQVINGIEGQRKYQESLRAAIEKEKEKWREQADSDTKEQMLDDSEIKRLHEKSNKKERRISIFLVIIVLLGNIPLSLQTQSYDAFVLWMLFYNMIMVVIIALLLWLKNRREEKSNQELQRILDEGNRQKEVWRELDEKVLGMIAPVSSNDVGKNGASPVSENLTSAQAVCRAMLANKTRLCEREHITFTNQLLLPDDAMNPVDMVTLLGNMLDNAIEACMRQKIGPKKITIKANMRANFWIIVMENTKSPEETSKDGALETQKENKEEHGFGLPIIQDIVKKYDGILKYEEQGETFVTQVMLRIQ